MRVLHLEDDPNDAELIRRTITDEWPGSTIVHCPDRAAYQAQLKRLDCDLILSDYTLVAFDGLEALTLARAVDAEVPFIFLSGTIGEDRALAALQLGADDYVLKDRVKRLVTAIRRVLRERTDRRERLEAERKNRIQIDLLNSARDAIFVTNEVNQVIFWNRAAERLLGRAFEIFEKISPLGKTEPDTIAIYGLIPIQQPADIYDGFGHGGRGGWSWYTGSAARLLSAAYGLVGIEKSAGEVRLADDAFGQRCRNADHVLAIVEHKEDLPVADKGQQTNERVPSLQH